MPNFETDKTNEAFDTIFNAERGYAKHVTADDRVWYESKPSYHNRILKESGITDPIDAGRLTAFTLEGQRIIHVNSGSSDLMLPKNYHQRNVTLSLLRAIFAESDIRITPEDLNDDLELFTS